ncbi:MAG: HAD family hydrolase [Candidatus Saccharimonadales bacterium]
MQYDVIFLDWEGTLSKSRFWGHWAADARRQKDYNLIQKRFFENSHDIKQDWMLGKLSAEEAVEFIADLTNMSSANLLTGLQKSCEQMQFIDERILEQVGKLRQNGTKVVISTDNMDTFTRWTVPALKLDTHVDEVLNSHTLKAFKKETHADGTSKFFADFFAQYGVEPSRSLLVDDSINNKVVENFGMDYQQVTSGRSASSILSELTAKI